ncbi:hypothetical protein BHAOGJBA_1671 [Methylobacterium hispanicum]|uniref:Uncharacterized protein n=1 Tax=Methylobacterium hispanicum TaxID=270350 RepID=A0AAV4ZJQ9_9HYPH|nr:MULTISPECIES: hypothetical protein [Methylobacterium]GJD88158.1 hypothetical protein BHAOGJBA_1671 [Methylobacterium hispanicum]
MTRKVLLAALALACAVFCIGFPVAAFAAEVATVGDTAVIVPWGQWVVAIAQTVTEILVPILVAGIGTILAKLFPPARMLLTDALVESTLRKWLAFGLNEVAGAARDKTLSFNVGSAVVAAALSRATDRASVNAISAWVLKQAGGEAEVAKKLTRMLSLEPDAIGSEVAGAAAAQVGART